MADAAKGSMAALISFDRDQLDLLVEEIDDLVIANDNSSSQVVLSGSEKALDNISKRIKAKRFLKLNVSGAFHSPFMKESSFQFSKYLDTLEFNLEPLVYTPPSSFNDHNWESQNDWSSFVNVLDNFGLAQLDLAAKQLQ